MLMLVAIVIGMTGMHIVFASEEDDTVEEKNGRLDDAEDETVNEEEGAVDSDSADTLEDDLDVVTDEEVIFEEESNDLEEEKLKEEDLIEENRIEENDTDIDLLNESELIFDGSPIQVGDEATAQISTDGTVVYNGTGDLYDYAYDESPWYNDISVERVVIGEGITSIGDCTFSGCTNLAEISLPDSLNKFGKIVFFNNRSLREIVIPEGVTALPENMFFDCVSLESINLPQSLEVLDSGAFWRCESLTEIKFPSSLNEIGNCTFFGCTGLTFIDLPTSVEKVDVEAFRECDHLESVKVEGSNTLIEEKAFSYGEQSLVIEGEEGSFAEAYAEEENIDFERIAFE